MSTDGPSNQNNENMNRNRRGSITHTALSGFFQRGNTTATAAGTPVFPPAAMNMNSDAANRRRLSITTLGISGTSPTSAGGAFAGLRRGSMSTNSDSIDENAIDDEDFGPGGPRTAPTTPFTRRMSFGAQAMRNLRTGGGSPGSNDQQGFNWSEQLRSRAESSVQGPRPSFSMASPGVGRTGSPPRQPVHERAKSVSEMPQPPAQAPRPKQPERPKPDHFQERILKGDFYMD